MSIYSLFRASSAVNPGTHENFASLKTVLMDLKQLGEAGHEWIAIDGSKLKTVARSKAWFRQENETYSRVANFAQEYFCKNAHLFENLTEDEIDEVQEALVKFQTKFRHVVQIDVLLKRLEAQKHTILERVKEPILKEAVRSTEKTVSEANSRASDKLQTTSAESVKMMRNAHQSAIQRVRHVVEKGQAEEKDLRGTNLELRNGLDKIQKELLEAEQEKSTLQRQILSSLTSVEVKQLEFMQDPINHNIVFVCQGGEEIYGTTTFFSPSQDKHVCKDQKERLLIHLPKFSKEIVANVVQWYLTFDQALHILVDQLPDLLACAQELGVKEFVEACEKIIITQIIKNDPSAAVPWVASSNPKIFQYAMKVHLGDIDKMLEKENLLKISPDQMKYLLRIDDLCIESEQDLLSKLIAWALEKCNHDQRKTFEFLNGRNEEGYPYLDDIRFEHMSYEAFKALNCTQWITEEKRARLIDCYEKSMFPVKRPQRTGGLKKRAWKVVNNQNLLESRRKILSTFQFKTSFKEAFRLCIENRESIESKEFNIENFYYRISLRSDMASPQNLRLYLISCAGPRDQSPFSFIRGATFYILSRSHDRGPQIYRGVIEKTHERELALDRSWSKDQIPFNEEGIWEFQISLWK